MPVQAPDRPEAEDDIQKRDDDFHKWDQELHQKDDFDKWESEFSGTADQLSDAEKSGSPSTDTGADQPSVKNAEETSDSGIKSKWSRPEEKSGLSRSDLASLAKNPAALGRKLISTGLRKKSPILMLVGLLVLLGLGSFLGPAMVGFSFVENIDKDVNDVTAALTNKSEQINLRRTLPSSEKSKALKGCGTLSLRCKFSTISDKQLARLNRAGITVVPEDTKFGGRIVPKAYTFQNASYSPEAWATELKKTNSPARLAQLRANNMKYIGFSDRSFFAMVARRFGVSKKPPGTKGTVRDRVNQLLTAGGTSEPSDLKIEQRPDEKGNMVDTLVDANGNPVLDASGKPITYTNANDAAKARDALAAAKAPKTPVGVTVPKELVGAASAFGVADLACSINQMAGKAVIAAKVASQMAMVKYAFGIASTIQKIKAGDGTVEDGQAIGTLLTDTDNRQTIQDVKSSAANAMAARNVNSFTDATMPNPNYGKSAMDSNLVLMSMTGNAATPTTTDTIFSLGGGINALLKGTGAVTAGLSNISSGLCGFVQSPAVRAAGIALAVAAAIGSSGWSIAGQIATSAALVAGIMVLNIIITKALSSSVLDVLKDPNETVGRGTAGWTGLASAASSNAMAHGLKPANKSEIVKYTAERNSVEQSYVAMESKTTHPLDITNQYSALGSVARSITSMFGYSAPSLTKLVTFPQSLTSFLAAPARALDQSRFDYCDDSQYKALGIDADIQCNVRFVPAGADAMDIDQVAEWMENTGCGGNGCVEKDTTTGLPAGYTPPDPSASQNAVLEFAKGATVGQFFADRILPNDYARYLDYCVYRTIPFGETFDETGRIGSTDKEWTSGQRCMDTTGEVPYFRAYTLARTAQEGMDEEDPTASYTSSTATSSTIVDKPNKNGWSSPINNGGKISLGWHVQASKGLHKGIDLPAPKGTSVTSAHDGTVTMVTNMGSCGWATVIKADGLNNIYAGYQHMDPSVKVGDVVKRGQVIGAVGTFCGSGYHLHFSIETANRVSAYADSGSNDTSLNPLDWIPLP